jgi:hypothetical protein
MKKYLARVAEITATAPTIEAAGVALRLALDEAQREEAEERTARHLAYLSTPLSIPSHGPELTARLGDALDTTHAQARAARQVDEDALDAARAKLVPIRERAQATLDQLRQLQSQHGELVNRLQTTNFFALRPHLPPTAERLLGRLSELVRDINNALFGSAAQLEKVPARLAALTPAQLRTTAEIPTPAERIGHDVASLSSAPAQVEANLREIVMLLAEVESRKSEVPYTRLERSRPEPTLPMQAVTGAPNGVRR